MNQFSIYFKIGVDHIATWQAFDHILFMAALCLRYDFKAWKRILVLITAFTIGHATSLTLSVLDLVNFPSKTIEILIPATIAVTALLNLFDKKINHQSKFSVIYWLVFLFGLIHGLGFSNDLKMIIGNNNLIVKLFAANLGIETIQIIFIVVLLIIQLICNQLLKINKRDYLLFLSGVIFGISVYLTLLRSF